MILSGSKIKEAIEEKTIIIDPFTEKKINSNSYNLSLANRLLVYNDEVLDVKQQCPTSEIIIPPAGYVLQPNQLYLGSTIERTFSKKYVPIIEGRSSLARLGLFVHITAGLGEAGFDGCWTLEMMCVKPLRIYSNIEVCQVYFNEISGPIDLCKSKKYQNSKEVMPSKMHEEFLRGK